MLFCQPLASKRARHFIRTSCPHNPAIGDSIIKDLSFFSLYILLIAQIFHTIFHKRDTMKVTEWRRLREESNNFVIFFFSCLSQIQIRRQFVNIVNWCNSICDQIVLRNGKYFHQMHSSLHWFWYYSRLFMIIHDISSYINNFFIH